MLINLYTGPCFLNDGASSQNSKQIMRVNQCEAGIAAMRLQGGDQYRGTGGDRGTATQRTSAQSQQRPL